MTASNQPVSTRRIASRWLVAAATVTLGAAATFGSALVLAQTPAPDAPPPPPMHGHGPHGPGPMGGPGFGMDRRLLDKVGASADQKARIATIFKAAFADLAPSRDADRAARSRMVDLLAAPTIDRAAIESLRIQQYQMRETESRRMTQAIADAAEVLTPAQRAQAAAAIREREAQHKDRADKPRDPKPARS